MSGFVIASSFFDIIYNNIWIKTDRIDESFASIPNEIYFGFEVFKDDFYIWNSNFQPITLEAIIPVNIDQNIYFLDDITGPYLPLQIKQTTLIIQSQGKPVINGYLIFQFNPPVPHSQLVVNITLSFKGAGYILFPINEYISENFELTYNFSIVISQNLSGKEQRRLLIDRSKKYITASFIIDNVNESNILNLSKLLDGQIALIPFVLEPLTPVANNLFGLTNIYVQEDFSQYFELFRTKFILIHDKSNNNAALRKIVNLQPSSKLITIEQPINKNFYKRTTKIYPAHFYIIKSINETQISKNAIIFDIEMEEIFSNLDY